MSYAPSAVEFIASEPLRVRGKHITEFQISHKYQSGIIPPDPGMFDLVEIDGVLYIRDAIVNAILGQDFNGSQRVTEKLIHDFKAATSGRSKRSIEIHAFANNLHIFMKSRR